MIDIVLQNERQKDMWHGWTAVELQACDALTTFRATMRQPTIRNAIHPIFQRQNWVKREDLPKNKAFWKIGMGHEGYWEVRALLLL